LEGPSTGESAVNEGKAVFNHPSYFLPCVADTFEAVQVANNHMLDQGEAGLGLTLTALQREGVAWVGAGRNLFQAWDYHLVEDKVALIAASYTCFNDRNATDCSTVARISDPDRFFRSTLQKIRTLHPQAAIGMLVHLGLEYDPLATHHHKLVARRFLDAGLDFFVGNHAHIPQQFELYRGKPIFYGLGNAVFDQDWGKWTMVGLAATLSFLQHPQTLRYQISHIQAHQVHISDFSQGYKPYFSPLDTDFRVAEWAQLD